MEVKKCIALGRRLFFCLHTKKINGVDLFKVKEDRVFWRRPPENPGYRRKEIHLKNYKTGDVHFTSSNLKLKTLFGWLVYNTQSTLGLNCLWKLVCFQNKGTSTNVNRYPKWSSLSESLRCSFLRVLHAGQLQGCWLRWSSLTDYSRQTSDKPYIFPIIPKLDNSFSLRIWLLSLFFQDPSKTPSPPDNRMRSREHDAHIPKRWDGVGGFWSFSGSHVGCHSYWSWSGRKLNKWD